MQTVSSLIRTGPDRTWEKADLTDLKLGANLSIVIYDLDCYLQETDYIYDMFS